MAKGSSKSNLNSQALAVDAAGGSVDKIRDILFGNQMQEYDRKFSKLEQLLTQKLSDFRDENRKRLDSLESFVKAELNSLEDRLLTEKKERHAEDKELSDELKETNKHLERRATELNDQVVKTEKTLRAQILDQSNTLRDEIQQCRDDLTRMLQSSSEDLQVSKMDRHSLAQMLTKVAFSISQDPQGEAEGS